MTGKIVEGLWDCPYCGTTAIGGLTKVCPCCGHPQDDGIKFYLGQEKKYLEADLAKEYGQGADWVCGYCGALNRARYKYCSVCGGAKDVSEKDYFKAVEQKEAKQARNASANAPTPPPKPKSKLPMLLLIAAIILAVIFWPRTLTSQVTAKDWTRAIDIQVERTVQESDWNVPDGGRVYKQAEEIHHYNSVLDHYETKSRQVPESVLDGYDTSYRDNGDGTFTEVSTPRYRTEYRWENYESPVYIQVPQYATKYYYEIERWFQDRTETVSGGDNEPYWPELSLGDKERSADRHERYVLTVADDKGKTYSAEVSLARWQSFKLHDSVKLTIVAGRLTKINGEPLK